MKSLLRIPRVRPGWAPAILILAVAAFVWLCLTLFAGTMTSYVPVTVTSDRSGLVLESGAKVKMRGVQVGQVASVAGGKDPARLTLQLFPDQIKHIPANVEADIRAVSLFGTKYIDLVYPAHPSPHHIAAGAVLRSRNVSTEVNTVFQSLVGVLRQIDPPKINAVLTAFADAVRGRGEQIGEAITAGNHLLGAINPRMGTVQQDARSAAGTFDAYSVAAQNILATLQAASTTSATFTTHSADLDALLLNVIGLSQSGIDVLGPNKSNLVHAINTLRPTTDLLFKYNPEYTCMLMGAKWVLDEGGAYQAAGGDGSTVQIDDAFLLGLDPYRYPENLPVVAAKGGPGGQPGCGSLPDVSQNYPVRQLVTNTGWGTGLDWRPNPGIGFPGWANFFPVTRGVPQPPVIRNPAPAGPAPGPIPYPGGPPYGAPLYGPDGAPLYALPPGAPPPPVPAAPAAPPPDGPAP